MANDAEFRKGVTQAYRDRVMGVLGWKIPAVTSAAELIELAKKAETSALEKETGLRTDPPFPGASDAPHEMPNDAWEMNCACRLYLESKELAVIFMTFCSGKMASIVVSPAGTAIPEEYSPIASR
jgi:hypothetical protein